MSEQTYEMDAQRTIKRQISCAGIGLHSGQKVTLTLKPAGPDTGIRFRRTDLGVEIPASVNEVSSVQHATVLGKSGATVETVEHLLAALVSAGIDNMVVELNHREVPIMDGSSAPFLYLLQEAGVKKLATSRKFLKILKPVQVSSGHKRIAVYPSDHFKVSYTISFDHPLLRHQSRTERITEQSFSDHIAGARTFGFLKEVEWLRQNGLALGGSLENAIVIGDTGVLNALRFEDEFVRHKILDAVGDLALLGHPMVGHVVAHRAGHALHTALAAEILKEKEAWCLVEAPATVPEGVLEPVGATGAVRAH
jgi:UDP-3-O-[3-hydroxymyristoyl] N-acetylglucosamine deacetylase